MDKWEILDHTFKFRVGDSEEKGGCTFIGGEWKDVSTDELFKDKKPIERAKQLDPIKDLAKFEKWLLKISKLATK